MVNLKFMRPLNSNNFALTIFMLCAIAILLLIHTLDRTRTDEAEYLRLPNHTRFTMFWTTTGDPSSLESSTTTANAAPEATSTLTKKTAEMPFSSSVGKGQTETVIRDSIYMFHFQNFVKPENEICEKRLPKCIIIGVPNSGTRELRDFLGLHPNIEIYNGAMQFFKNDDLYGKGDDWLKRQMPCTYSNQLTAIENEAYFHDLQVPERIYQFDKSIKLILVVKEPISRSISHFKFLQDGKFIPKAANYSDVVLDAKTNALNTQHPVLNMSIYDDNMRVWLRYFSLSQILIIESEKLNREPSSVLKRVEEFVGLEHYIRPNMFVYNKEQLFPCIRSNLTLTGMACHGDNDSRNETKPEDTASSEVIDKLKEFFKPRNAKFFKLIDKSFAW